ncbi:MAG TPA: hypothetical protein VEK78_09380 [Gemmatimonadales bacterium]|nr:hypothetical protein [Gemmatimonadales bacterium]HYT84683.1 hypothetical protein [Gemmatimonadales bacterium]
MEAMALCLLVSSLGFVGLACKEPRRAGAPAADAGPVLTVYAEPQTAQRLMSRVLDIAARHQWAVSLRTDSAALGEADLVIVDSAGRLVPRIRAGSNAAARARQLAEAVLQ